MNEQHDPSRTEIRQGLRKIRSLIPLHWIQGTYVTTSYLNGDGVYEDGAIVHDTKVVGCLVGLARLVGAKQPTYFFNSTKTDFEEPEQAYGLAGRLIDEILNTIEDEFSGPEYYDPAESLSIEGWNDTPARSQAQVIAMLDRAIERV